MTNEFLADLNFYFYHYSYNKYRKDLKLLHIMSLEIINKYILYNSQSFLLNFGLIIEF